MPMLGESEKARLQRIFEWSNGGIPTIWRDIYMDIGQQVDTEEAQLIKKSLLGQGALRKQKRWLDILAKEVVERETVLKVMRAERQEHLSKGKLRHEIQERIKRMKEIQNNITRHERLQQQSQLAELVDLNKSCHATYNAQREKNNYIKINNKARNSVGGLSSHYKRLLEHNLNTASTDKSTTNHRRYKHSHNVPNFTNFLPPKGFNGIKLEGQSKENHHHYHDQENHHHYKENQHHHKENHRHHVEKCQERALKTSRHHRTSCRSESELKTKSTSRP